MATHEQRARIISALLQAGGPVSLERLAAECDVAEAAGIVDALHQEDQVLLGDLAADGPAPHCCWWACWERLMQERLGSTREALRARVAAAGEPTRSVDLDDAAARALCEYVTQEYEPPPGKPTLVVLQCSVRRPFSSSPSHASMKRAIALATGYDPQEGFARCPVHVVVLASKVGPVPYEFEDLYPANVRSGGVKHASPQDYARIKPILAQRMGDYVAAHRSRYERVLTFTESRYGEVMAEAAAQCGLSLTVLPLPDGPRVLRMGESKPRTYWQKHWIQLYLAILETADEGGRSRAARRLGDMDVEYEA